MGGHRGTDKRFWLQRPNGSPAGLSSPRGRQSYDTILTRSKVCTVWYAHDISTWQLSRQLLRSSNRHLGSGRAGRDSQGADPIHMDWGNILGTGKDMGPRSRLANRLIDGDQPKCDKGAGISLRSWLGPRSFERGGVGACRCRRRRSSSSEGGGSSEFG